MSAGVILAQLQTFNVDQFCAGSPAAGSTNSDRLCRLNRTMSLSSAGAELTDELPQMTDDFAFLYKDERICRICGNVTSKYCKPAPGGVNVECKLCQALLKRMYRLFLKNEGLRKSWYDMLPSARREWFKGPNKHMRGTDLAKAMALHIEKSGLSWDASKPYFHKCFCDRPELKRRYKGIAEEIKKVKRKVFDERRQGFLYEDYQLVGENIPQKVVEISTHRGGVTPVVRPSHWKPYTPRIRGPKYYCKTFDRLNAKLAKARAEADKAIAEHEDEDELAVGRLILIQQKHELEHMCHEIDIVANGNHSSLATAGAKRETMELVSTHKKALMSFSRVRKSMLKSSEFEYGL